MSVRFARTRHQHALVFLSAGDVPPTFRPSAFEGAKVRTICMAELCGSIPAVPNRPSAVFTSWPARLAIVVRPLVEQRMIPEDRASHLDQPSLARDIATMSPGLAANFRRQREELHA